MLNLSRPIERLGKVFRGRKKKPKRVKPWRFHPEMTEHERSLVLRYKSDTMTGELRQSVLLKAIDYVDRRQIPGAIVECGVWRGGNMLMAKAARVRHPLRRDYYLYDTFTGMTAPTAEDIITSSGASVYPIYTAHQRDGYNAWCYSPLEDVKRRFLEAGLLDDSVHFIEGPVEETLPEQGPAGPIAILRLDTDWYSSTKAELEHLYPLLSPGGVLIIDDYGTYDGARKATEEYFRIRPVLLVPIDMDCRVAIKV